MQSNGIRSLYYLRLVIQGKTDELEYAGNGLVFEIHIILIHISLSVRNLETRYPLRDRNLQDIDLKYSFPCRANWGNGQILFGSDR